MNILVTGANGQLGNEMRLIAKSRPSDHFIFSDINEHPTDATVKIDITKPLLFDGELDYIINCAAYTNVDAAEDNEELAYLLNCMAVENLASLAKTKGASLIHVSTDYVFNGEGDRPLTEDDPVDPVSAYGRTKLKGEQALQASGCSYVIIRTAWLYSEFGKNFMKTMIRLTSEKDVVNVVNDQIGCPTYAMDLAEAIMKVVDCGISEKNCGIYHYSNEGICSWYDFASAIAAISGHPGVVQPCSSDAYPSKVKRPAFSALDKKKIHTVFGVDIPAWEASLNICYKSYIKTL